MEKHTCKICNRRFANGKALGGHIRSHLVKLPVPPKPQSAPSLRPPRQQPQQVEQQQPAVCSSSSPELKPRIDGNSSRRAQVYRSLNHSFSSIHDSDRESDTELRRSNPARRRSKRLRQSSSVTVAESPPPPAYYPPLEAEPVVSSSVASRTTSSEDEAALALLMLSRGCWSKKEKATGKLGHDDAASEENEIENEMEIENESVSKKPTMRFQCKKCKKSFRSYQALGGHKASHKKVKDQEIETKGGNRNYVNDHKNFQCPFCYKMFDSGQALGGHKKVHFSSSSSSSHVAANARNYRKEGDHHNLMIDLNQLPEEEEEEEEEDDDDDDEQQANQAEFSPVFSRPRVFHFK